MLSSWASNSLAADPSFPCSAGPTAQLFFAACSLNSSSSAIPTSNHLLLNSLHTHPLISAIASLSLPNLVLGKRSRIAKAPLCCPRPAGSHTRPHDETKNLWCRGKPVEDSRPDLPLHTTQSLLEDPRSLSLIISTGAIETVLDGRPCRPRGIRSCFLPQRQQHPTKSRCQPPPSLFQSSFRLKLYV